MKGHRLTMEVWPLRLTYESCLEGLALQVEMVRACLRRPGLAGGLSLDASLGDPTAAVSCVDYYFH